jgi:menaquinone-dependent protoporphyrinogen oxidase
MKILAVYGSNYGQAQAVLGRVATALEARGHDVSTVKGDSTTKDLTIEGFDAVIVAASIRMGRYQTYIRDFVRRHGAVLRERPTAFVSVNGTRPESDPEWRAEAEGYVREFLEQTSWDPRWTANFAGSLPYRRYDPLTRLIMKRINGKRGGETDTSRDFEFTDWSAVDRFADDLAGALGETPQ